MLACTHAAHSFIPDLHDYTTNSAMTDCLTPDCLVPDLFILDGLDGIDHAAGRFRIVGVGVGEFGSVVSGSDRG